MSAGWHATCVTACSAALLKEGHHARSRAQEQRRRKAQDIDHAGHAYWPCMCMMCMSAKPSTAACR
jgi:hypothetical protein